MDTKKLGAFGEKIAEDYLKNKGYQILDKNYSPKWISGPIRGEIDIVAKPQRSIFDILIGKKEIIHFIEVKILTSYLKNENSDTLSSQAISTFNFSPENKVNFQKYQKIKETAEKWLMEKKIPLNSRWQIDVVSIKIDLNSKKAKIRHFKNIVFH